MMMTGALGIVGPTIGIDKSKMTPNQKKTSATIAGAILGGVGVGIVNDVAKGKSFVWNTNINKGLKKVAAKAADFVKNSPIKKYAGKMTQNNPTASKIGGFIQNIANSGAEGIKNIATKVAKTSGRQKLLAAVAVGTLGLIMAAREHYSKEAGATAQKADDKAALKLNNVINDKKLEAKDIKIAELETKLDMKKAENEALYKTIEKADKAAEKLGVDKQLAEEMIKPKA